MIQTRWILAAGMFYLLTTSQAFPRELSSDELITEPRPGEEYVNIHTGGPPVPPSPTSVKRVKLTEQSYRTSHQIPGFESKKKKNPETFATSHKIWASQVNKELETSPSDHVPSIVQLEPTTTQPSVEILTRTSVKMTKSKKVQKTGTKSSTSQVKIETKSDAGVIDESMTADQEEQLILAKKFTVNEDTATTPAIISTPEVTTVPTTIFTTEEPPVTTFTYKNIYDKTKRIENEEKKKKEAHKKKEEFQQKEFQKLQRKDNFEIINVNKNNQEKHQDFDFVDTDERVVPAGSSLGQTSRVNVKKGPNGQDYEYEYVYYYYDEDDDLANGTAAVTTGATEKIFNGHDGPPSTPTTSHPIVSSTSGNKYLPTSEEPKQAKTRSRPQQYLQEEQREEEEEDEEDKAPSRQKQYTSVNRNQHEPVSNEVLPANGRTTTRSRGRITNIPGAQPAPAEDVPDVAEERLPANTRFPPRSRSQNTAQSTTIPAQTADPNQRTRSREQTNNSRVRLPNLGLDGSSFRTHSSAQPPNDEFESSRSRSTTEPDTTSTKRTRHEEQPATRRHSRISTTPAIPTSAAEEVQSSRRPTIRRPNNDKYKYEVREEDTELEEDEQPEKIVGNGRRPETTRESDAEEIISDIPRTTYTSIRRPTTTLTSENVDQPDVTTEDLSKIGLTSAMMEKVALDLYAILQQAHNENIKTNLVNDVVGATTVDVVDEVDPTEPATTTTTSTTTTTTTTEQPPTSASTAAGRGRYKTRGGGATHGQPQPRPNRFRSSASSTTSEVPSTTEASQRTRPKFHAGQNRRTSTRTKTEENTPATGEETPSPDKTFGTSTRTRYRGTGSKTGQGTGPTSTTTSAPQPSPVTRTNSIDRYNSRRRGNRVSSSTTPAPEESEEQGADVPVESSSTTAKTPRNKPAIGSARPLRPGPRVPLAGLTSKGRISTTTAAPVTPSEVPSAPVEAEEEQIAPIDHDVPDVQTTPPPDALTRLKNRPRLRIGSAGSHSKSTSTTTQAPNRRQLVSSLLPKRKNKEPEPDKPAQEAAETVAEEEPEVEEEEAAEQAAAPEVSSTTEAENKGLSGLLAGRRRNLNRRPGTIYTKAHQTE